MAQQQQQQYNLGLRVSSLPGLPAPDAPLSLHHHRPPVSRRGAAVKRLMKEAEELREATEEYYAQPLDVSASLA